MNQEMVITHYYHSGFSVAWQDLLFVFDYWRGEKHELPPKMEITPEGLRRFRQVYVFISHEHPDHLDPIVFSWMREAPVSYIVSSDMPIGVRGKRMAPMDEIMLEEGVTVRAFDSTDLGVSFLLDLNGFRIFHAGDLNFWHWRDESTIKEIEEAEREFQDAVRPLSREKIDIAFFPVDPRQGTMFEAGANFFLLSVKPRLMIPMHYFRRAEIAEEYARTASSRTSEVLAMTEPGGSILVRTSDDGYLDVSFLREEEAPSDGAEEEDSLLNSPFDETDLPLPQLAEEPENQGTDELST